MRLENTFDVPARPDQTWELLNDVPRVVPCMPGAELTEVIDDRHWKGKMKMKFGPVAMAFAGTVAMESRDDEARRVVLHAKGMEQKGKGAANATVTSWVEPGPAEGQSSVKMEADITLTGAVAQLSRGLLPEISKKLTQQFADCLQASMGQSEAAPAPEATSDAPVVAPAATPTSSTAKPVGGIGLGLSAIWAVIRGFFARLFGPAPKA